MTDEELARYEIIKPCPSCGSNMVNVRQANNRWYYVGCMDCFNKTLCEEKYIDYAVERWNNYARRCGKC